MVRFEGFITLHFVYPVNILLSFDFFHFQQHYVKAKNEKRQKSIKIKQINKVKSYDPRVQTVLAPDWI